MPVFLVLGTIGFGLLVLSLIFDHGDGFDHGDVSSGGDISDHDWPGWLNVKVIAAFLAAFGFVGAFARYYSYSMMQSSLMGLGGGLVLGGLMYWLLYFLYSQQASSHVTTAEVLKSRGVVSIAIRDGSPGEVTLTARGNQYSYVARTLDGNEIKEGSAVEVVEFLGETAVVKPVRQ